MRTRKKEAMKAQSIYLKDFQLFITTDPGFLPKPSFDRLGKTWYVNVVDKLNIRTDEDSETILITTTTTDGEENFTRKIFYNGRFILELKPVKTPIK